jgi:REP element-mobilizing transposase RayT
MARKLRIQYPGAMYHVMNRGDRREAIFEDDQDRQRFLSTLGQACQKTDWQVHAFCLMSNHFHLVLETPQPNLVAGMKWFLGTYTSRHNRRHKEFGHLFSGRYKALPVDGSGNGYLKSACDYVHLNPARAGLIPPRQPLSSFAWSSFPLYLAPARRPSWLRVDRLLGEWRIPKDSSAGRRVFNQQMERRRREDSPDEFRQLESSWYLGSEQFRRELLEQVHTAPGPSHFGEAVHEAVEVRAERLVSQALQRLGWTELDLVDRPKSHPAKLQLAHQLRAQTTLSVAWVAQRLSMGSRAHLAWLLKGGKPSKRTQPDGPSQALLAI